MATIILAGGLSSRMGKDKATIAWGGESLLQTLVSRFDGIFGEVIVVANEDQKLSPKGARVVTDILLRQGPLGGLHAGLLASDDDLNFLVACDMPFASPDVAFYLSSQADGYDAIIPMLERGSEPLFGVYRKSCLARMESILLENSSKMRLLLDQVKTRYIHEDELRKLDPDLRCFANLNTPEELARARHLA